MEKKLNDEEIVKAFEHCNKSLPHDKCLLSKQHKEDWVTCQSKCGRMIIDLIHRLQAENKGKTEHLEKCLDEIERLKTANTEQKAEIERLKNAYREGLEQGKFDSQVKIEELQKQVGELKDERENMQAEILRFEDMKFTQKHCDLYSENETLKQWLKRLNADLENEKNWGKIQTKQAVKDTAKEIIKWIKLNGLLEYGGYVIHDSTIEQMCKKFGVGVE